jgi:flagellar capping protein FliD
MDDDVQAAFDSLKEENASLTEQLSALQDSVNQTTDAYKTRFEAIERYVRDLATALNNTPPLVIGTDALPGVKIPIPGPPW